jgi:hypothetical protein
LDERIKRTEEQIAKKLIRREEITHHIKKLDAKLIRLQRKQTAEASFTKAVGE